MEEKRIKNQTYSLTVLALILFIIFFGFLFWTLETMSKTLYPVSDTSVPKTRVFLDLEEDRSNPPPSDLKIEVSVEDQIRKIAIENNFENEELLLRIAFCESSYDFLAINYNKNGSVDRGIFQWNDKWHPEVSDECAFDIECATINAIRVIKEKGPREWTCGKILGL